VQQLSSNNLLVRAAKEYYSSNIYSSNLLEANILYSTTKLELLLENTIIYVDNLIREARIAASDDVEIIELFENIKNILEALEPSAIALL
jgi:hypothetical protein